MAVQQATQTLSTILLPETASRVILLTREVIDNKDGSVKVNFGATVHPTTTVYEVDGDAKPIAVYESVDLPSFDVSQEQLASLFGVQVTLVDGTVTSLENLFANWADQIIKAKLGLDGAINTQMINLDPVGPAVV